ncbi:MAG: UDP-N-acetylmuramoyl-tripeptide--D-alanyl-D-alanine ligase [Clostridiales bacterium]|nr:UDP-N-acetylmuramoyl-tripeptide--D-alanyl-D-alanine ligase [Clostridiales bacterium]
MYIADYHFMDPLGLILNLLLVLASAVSLLLSARKFVHYFQLESYQFQGYFRTLQRQKAVFSCLKLSGIHLLLNVVFVGANLLLYHLDRQQFANWVAGEENYVVNDAYLLLSIVTAPLFILAVGWIGRFFRKQGMKKAEKKKFALTARLKRFYLVFFILLLVCQGAALLVSMQVKNYWFAFLGYWNVLFALLLPLLVALAAILALPIEKFIFRLYFNDAEKKLLENEKLIRIGITGSYGKTSTKFILANILSQKYNVLATPASFNTPMGVTRIIRERLTPSHQVFIGEMGARHVGEIKELSRLVHPKIGVLTAVGPQHLDTFRTIERIEKTKYELIDALPEDGFSVFLHDNAIVTKLYEKTQKPKAIAGKENGDVWAENVQVSSEGSHFTLRIKGWEPIECTAPLLGEHNIRNILMACAVAVHLGLNKEQIVRGIATLKPIEHRLQLLRSAGGITVIDDAFNTNPRSSKEALKVLSMFPGRRIIVTPGMVELGAEEEKYNYEFGQAMAKAVDVAVLVGKKHTQPIQKGLKDAGFPEENIHVMGSLDEAIAFNRQQLRAGDVVMYENDLPDHYSES